MHFIKTTIHRLIASTAFSTLMFCPAWAQSDYPNLPVKVIVPQTTGGANETIARIVTAKLSVVLGQQFIVENRA